MPAKTEYLSSGWTRFSKVMAVIFGAYICSILILMAIAKNVPDDTPVLLTSTYLAFIMWVGFMVMIYLIEKAWVSWLILFSLSAVSALLIFL